MVNKKAKKELDKKVLSRVKKEIAEPRMANSVRDEPRMRDLVGRQRNSA